MIEIGTSEFGKSAIFIGREPISASSTNLIFIGLRNKKPKISLNHESTYSGYSSEAKINSQANKLSEAATKSNSITHASKVRRSELENLIQHHLKKHD